jgi:hypothetical protein
MATLLVVICLLLSHHLVIAIDDPNTVQLDRTADILRTTTTNTDTCSDDTSGCIPGDTVEGTDCTDSTVCRTVSADYCGGVFGTPTRRVCCKSRGTTTTTTTTDTDTIGCPVENRGCMFSDKVEGTDCTTGGSDTCRTMGADYCSAKVGSRRVCCMVTRTTTPEFTATTDEQCPDWNHRCIFTDHVNGTDCTTGGTATCQQTTTDGRTTMMNTFTTTATTHSPDTTATTMMTTRTIAAYCSAMSGTDRRRVCCHTHLYTTNTPMTTTTTSNTPTATATTTITEFTDTHMEGRTACPAKTSGCIYTDKATTTDCTTGGSALCLSTGSDYCSSMIRGKRVCCTATTTTTTRPTTTARTTTPTTTDTTTDRCPRENSGCIIGDTVEGTDCSMTGSAGCVTVGADYCSATMGNKRVCCTATGKTTKTETTTTKTTTDPDTAGCPGTNFGCLFDDQAMTGTDCTTDHTTCNDFGTDYCGAMVSGKRVCCRTTVMTRPKLTDTTNHQCPEWNHGCIFDDTVNGTDCTSDNTICTVGDDTERTNTAFDATTTTFDKMTPTVLNAYCSAPTGTARRRVCCHVNPMTTSTMTMAMPTTTATVLTTTKTTPTTDPTKACPTTNSGCIWTDRATGIDCTTDGHLMCKKSKTDYCSAFANGRRTCCTTTTTRMNEKMTDRTPGRETGNDDKTEFTTDLNKHKTSTTSTTTDRCPTDIKGCIFGDTVEGTDCSRYGSSICRTVGADYCSAVTGWPTPKRVCCKTRKARTIRPSRDE